MLGATPIIAHHELVHRADTVQTPALPSSPSGGLLEITRIRCWREERASRCATAWHGREMVPVVTCHRDTRTTRNMYMAHEAVEIVIARVGYAGRCMYPARDGVGTYHGVGLMGFARGGYTG